MSYTATLGGYAARLTTDKAARLGDDPKVRLVVKNGRGAGGGRSQRSRGETVVSKSRFVAATFLVIGLSVGGCGGVNPNDNSEQFRRDAPSQPQSGHEAVKGRYPGTSCEGKGIWCAYEKHH